MRTTSTSSSRSVDSGLYDVTVHDVAELILFVWSWPCLIINCCVCQNGVGQKANPLIDYVIIINGETKLADFSELLLPNVWIVTRDNSCYDGGAIGQVLEDHPTLWLYKYFVLINSSVRGPFLPHYWPSSLPWTAAFTQLINDRVKLVGTTISCELQVHVQSMLLATDQIGLKALREEGALSCPTSMREAINGYELGSTAAMFKRG